MAFEEPSIENFLASNLSEMDESFILGRDNFDWGVMEGFLSYLIFFDQTAERGMEWLHRMKKDLERFIEEQTMNHIWHKQGITLKVRVPPGRSEEAYLTGRTEFGENIEDEWLIVSVLCMATKAFPGSCVQVTDPDGEFLLIETALEIPGWLKPKSSVNRVWLREDAMHIVPRQIGKGALDRFQALCTVRDESIPTIAAPNIQKALKRRLKRARDTAQSSKHRFVCLLPLAVAHVFQKAPEMIVRAVHAFYTRDPIDMGACNKMERFPVTDVVRAPLTLTRHLYAQLTAAQQFHPPKPFQALANCYEDTHQEKGCETGIRLACGLEMVYQKEAQELRRSGQRQEAQISWEGFVRCLQRRDFFEGEIEGSRRYKEKIATAKQFYAEKSFVFYDGLGQDTDEEIPDLGDGDSLCQTIDALLKSLPSPSEFPNTASYPEDDDSWMEISPDDLEALLNSDKDALDSYLEDTEDEEEEEEAHQTERLKEIDDIVSGMKCFLSATSGLEGVEAPTEWNPEVAKEQDDGCINFDMGRLMEVLSEKPFYSVDEVDHSDSTPDLESYSDLEMDAERGNVDWPGSPSVQNMDSTLSEMQEVNKSNKTKMNNDNSNPGPIQPQSQPNVWQSLSQESVHGLFGVLQESDVIATEVLDEDSDDDEGSAENSDDEDIKDMEAPVVVNDSVFLEEYMESMEKQLGQSSLAESFEVKGEGKHEKGKNISENSGIPVDIDLNLVHSILESYSNQPGEPGPATNILRDLGIRIPPGAVHSNGKTPKKSDDL